MFPALRAPPPNRSAAKPPTATASTTTAAEKDSASSTSSGDTSSTTTDSSESKSAAASGGGGVKQSRHKWPLRPGVHVHVNGLHAMHNNNNGKDGDGGGDGEDGAQPPTASRGTSTSNRAVNGEEADNAAAASDVVDGSRAQGMRDRQRPHKIFPHLCLARIPREWAFSASAAEAEGRVMNFAF